MDTRTVSLAATDTTLEVLEAGVGGRPLLLVHGFTGAKEDFADHLDQLADLGWHAVAPDNRGHGNSDHPEGQHSYSLALFTADVIALADALAWDRFVLLGHSMGGMVAQVVALEHPDRLRALILMDTSHAAPDGLDPAAIELGKAVVSQGGMAVLVEAQRGRDGELDTPANKRLVAEKPGYAEFGERKALASSADMWLAMVDEMLTQPDRLGRLASLSMPSLVLVGEQDASFTAHAERMAAAIPAATLVVVPDAGHSPQFENPEAWWTAVSDFLGDLPAA